MLIQIDQMNQTPIYLQLRNQIVTAIAQGELVCGDRLPSVRALAVDLGINLHTVNKAYAVLRDEGYILMRGRAGAVIASPLSNTRALARTAARQRLEDALLLLMQEHKAQGETRQSFMRITESMLDSVFGKEGNSNEC